MAGGTFFEYDTLCWHWYRVQVPRPGSSNSVDSPTFCLESENEIFYLQIDQSERDGVVTLWLCRYASPRSLPSFGLAVRVWQGYDDARPHVPSSFNVCDWTNAYEINIWQREISKIEQMFPGFVQRCALNFEIMITDDPGSLTCGCPKTIRTSLSADASVQTNLDAYSISSLDTLSEDILRMNDSSDLDPEVELHCEGRTARAHRALLSVRSPVLATMLRADMKEGRTGIVHFKDMDADTFQLFLNHLHSGKLERESLSFDAALRLYQAGNMYQVDSLSRMCSQILVENLTADSACDILVMADGHDDSHLVEAATQYMLENRISRPGNEGWESFCRSNPNLALRVANRYIKELTDSSAPPRKRHRADEIICVE